MKYRKTALVLGAVLLLSGLMLCSCTARKPLALPSVSLTVNSQTVGAYRGEYIWRQDGRESRMRGPAADELAANINPLLVQPGSIMNIKYGQVPVSVTVSRYEKGGYITQNILNGNSIQLPEIEGVYIYTITSTWEQGKITDVFKIQVQR